MDQLITKSASQMCLQHCKKKIKFIQVNSLSDSPNKNLFYCTSCINNDLSFKGINYLLISQIIDEGDTNVIQKWPPLNDYSVIDQLIQFTQHNDSSSSIANQINKYFTQLKDEFLRKVDLCEKQMINRALELPFGKESILKQYQDISQISQLRSILMQGEKLDSEEYKHRCQQFISQIESQKNKNSELLNNLLKQCDQKQQLVNFEYPNLIKESIFSFIDQIDFFNSQESRNISKISNINENSNAHKLMKLISNKSNFCSTSFLKQIQELLERINPIIQSISFGNMHEQNRSPLNFDILDTKRFDLITELIGHQIKIEQSREYSQQIENTYEHKCLQSIINSNVNFVNNNLQAQLKQYLIDTHPLLKQINFSNPILDKEKFESISTLTTIEIEDLYTLIKTKKALAQDSEFKKSQTRAIIFQNQNTLSQFEDVDVILRKYPIFDLMKIKQVDQIQVKLMSTSYADGLTRTQINEHKQISINETYYNGIYRNFGLNCVSDIILDKKMKYVFRFKIEYTRQDKFYVNFGLMSNSKCDIKYGLDDQLSCRLMYNNSQIQYSGENLGISKLLKGESFKLSKDNEVEMRVWLGGKILEIVDYPKYKCKLGIKDDYKNKLNIVNDLKLFIGIVVDSIKVTLKHSQIVDDLPQ